MEFRSLTDPEKVDWLRLSLSENIGPVTFYQLIARFGSAEEAIAGIPDLIANGGSKRGLRLYSRESAERDYGKAISIGAQYLAACEPGYPEWLRNIPAAPPLICVCGKLNLLERPAIAVVGARNASAVGLRLARTFSAQLAEAGFVIVSGLARGIDTAAHEATLRTGTIAVLAGGIDHIYPPENEKLHRTIAENGVLLCENPPGTVPKAEHFPRRNRIISGLSRATIVIEAAMRSGSLITARFANEQGREVFAVPGSPLDPRCEGTNRLIKDGAHMLTQASDVLDALGLNSAGLGEVPLAVIAANVAPTADVRQRVEQLLSPTPIEIDVLVRESGASAEEVIGAVLELELAGQATRTAGGKIALLTH